MQFTIKQARNHAGLTQADMAERLGVDRSTYIKIEKDPERVTLGQIRGIARETGIPVEDIFFGAISTKVENEPHTA